MTAVLLNACEHLGNDTNSSQTPLGKHKARECRQIYSEASIFLIPKSDKNITKKLLSSIPNEENYKFLNQMLVIRSLQAVKTSFIMI